MSVQLQRTRPDGLAVEDLLFTLRRRLHGWFFLHKLTDNGFELTGDPGKELARASGKFLSRLRWDGWSIHVQ